MNFGRHGMILVLALAVLLIMWALERRNKSAHSQISLDDLLIGDDGKMSKAATVMFGSFALTTWVVVYLTINDKLTDIIFGAYLTAWVFPVVANILKGPQVLPDPPAMTTTATVVTTTVEK